MNVENICVDNISEIDRKFLRELKNQSFPRKPYKCAIPYKKVRYMLNKYIELGVLELNNYGFECEITCGFTRKGYELLAAIRLLYGCAELCQYEGCKGDIMELKTIKIKYVKDGMEKIKQIENGDWIDLRTAEDVTLEAGEFKLIPLGFAMMLPKGYEALVIPRSSTFKKYGIFQANSVGLIDETYCGNNDEWKFPAFATRAVYIPKNTRICQFRIIEHQPPVDIVEVAELSEVNRGGFGSTGEK